MKIKTIRLYNLRVVELLAFLKHINPSLLLLTAGNAKLKRLVEGLSKTTVALSVAQNRGSFKGETKSVKQAGKRRTESLKLFCKFVDAFSHSDNPTVKEQATLLLAAIKKEKPHFTGSNQNGQTGGVNGLNSLFTTDSRYTESLAALAAKPHWDKVMLADESYDGTYINRIDVKASAEGTESATEIGRKACSECKVIFEMVDSLYNVEEKPELLSVITKINIEIDAVMVVVHKRESEAEKEKEEKRLKRLKKQEEKKLKLAAKKKKDGEKPKEE